MNTDLPDDLGLLLALDVLLHERHVTRAARRLGVSQGAASQKLARLREFFHDPLLVAGRPLLLPTPRAQAIAAPLARALAGLRAAVRAGAPFDPATSARSFVLLGNDLLEAAALPSLLDVFARTAPGVTVRVERTDADFATRLENGTADVAFVPDFLVGNALRRRALPPDRFVVLLRRDHPAARRKLTLERYLELRHILIAPRGLPGSIVDTALATLGRHRQVVVRVQHFLSAPALVASSDLAATCPQSVFDGLAAWFPMVAVPAPLSLPIDHASMVWHERAHDDPGHLWLRGCFHELLRKRPSSATGAMPIAAAARPAQRAALRSVPKR